MLKAVFFDLDGTLLPFAMDEYLDVTFDLMFEKFKKYGYDRKILQDGVRDAIYAMYNNDGKKTNEEIYWDYLKEHVTNDLERDKKLTVEFYENDFKKVEKVYHPDANAPKIVRFCREIGLKTILATNPFYPTAATKNRVEAAGLTLDDFDFYTVWDNSYFAKPNPEYFYDILRKMDLKKDEVIMFGNCAKEDFNCCVDAGIKCYLVGDYLLNKEKAKKPYTHLKMNEVIDTIRKEVDSRR